MMDFKVRVDCGTYNQSSYILNAMNGFCIQETTFPFVCTIVDDDSTDGEQDVIKDYLNQHFVLEDTPTYIMAETDDYVSVFAHHKNNKNCYFIVLFLKYNHYSIKKDKRHYLKGLNNIKYLAYCEGDDYWTDSKKLKEQADFLDNHEEYSMCCGGYQRCVERKLEKEVVFNKPNCSGYSFTLEDNLESWHTKTLTSMVRTKDMGDFWKNLSKYKYGFDTHLFYHLLAKGDGYYFSKIMGVYNVQSGGIFSMADHKKTALMAADSYRELYENNNHDKRLKKVLFNWICIEIVECFLPIKDVLKEACYAQKLVQSVGMELNLFKATGIGIYRRMRYGTKRM